MITAVQTGWRAALVLLVPGLAFGSFANVVIWRAPRGLSVVRPPSACPRCARRLHALDMVPVLSWLALRGRCRSCHAPISIRYPVVEALVGLLVAAVGWRYGLSWDAAIFGCLAVGLVTLGAIDLEHMRLPSPVVYVTAASCGLLILAAGTQQHRWAGLGWAAGCAAVALAVLGAIRWYYPSGMGAGDVRLAGLVGLVLGWSGPGDTLVGFLAGMLIAAAAGLVLIAAGRADRRTPIPFGTCLAAGAMLAVLAGPTIVSWYQTSIR